MRRLLAVVAVAALAACNHGKATGPKWPEPSTTAEDGGESIAPRPSTTYAAAIEKSADVEEKVEAKTPVTPAAATGDDKPVVTPAATTPATDDVLNTEEIIIEIDD